MELQAEDTQTNVEGHVIEGPFGNTLPLRRLCAEILDCPHSTPTWTDQGVIVLRNQNIRAGRLDISEPSYTDEANFIVRTQRALPVHGDLVITREAPMGEVCMIPPGLRCCLGQRMVLLRPLREAIEPRYLLYAIQSSAVQNAIRVQGGTGSTVSNLRIPVLAALEIALPPTKVEQEAVAEALSDADALIESLEQLLAKKGLIKRGAMQELLIGTKRLPGFGGEWTVKQIAKIAFPSSDKNVSGEHLPVLTCSKHLGFVDSLAYFKNQVFSRDTSGYKVIKRGQIGYPSNHVEEGSIGLQDLYDVALVSPIYVVFSVTEEVDSYFLHRLLKLDSYRQAFATATSSSVDRRGSLRWPAFSQITVSLPRTEEQTAVVGTLRDMEAEMAALEAKLAKARQLKQGMMQELLTGRIRLV